MAGGGAAAYHWTPLATMRERRARLDSSLAAALDEVQPALAAWRKQRKPREPIPESLWHAIARVARDHQPSPVAQALRVNYAALKRRVMTNSRDIRRLVARAGKN
jgi:hypothetical protein